jgi:hypothetical protein
VRLASIVLRCLGGEKPAPPNCWPGCRPAPSTTPLVLPDVPGAQQAPRVFERSLMAQLARPTVAPPAWATTCAPQGAPAHVRERLSQEHCNLIERADDELRAQHQGLSADADLRARRRPWRRWKKPANCWRPSPARRPTAWCATTAGGCSASAATSNA